MRSRVDYLTVHPARTPSPCRRRSTSLGRLSIAVACLVALTAVASCSSGSEVEAGSSEGIPPVELVSLTDGEATSTDELLGTGTPTVVNVWASWCVPCIAEMPAFEEVSQAVDGRVAVIGVTDDRDVDAARDLAERTGVTYPLYRDDQRTMLPALQVTGLPATLFVNGDGTVAERHSGALDADELQVTIDRLWGTA